MSDEKQSTDEHEEAYPGHGPHSDGPTTEDHSDPVEQEVEDRFPVTPGTETPEERAKIADERREELDAARGDGDEISKREDEDDDEPELSDESNDEEPVQPADDSPVHDEDTIQPGSTDPTL